MGAVQDARARAVGVGRAAGEQLRGDRARRLALPAPRRAVQQVRVRRAPLGGRAEDRERVRMGFERGEGHVTSPKVSARIASCRRRGAAAV